MLLFSGGIKYIQILLTSWISRRFSFLLKTLDIRLLSDKGWIISKRHFFRKGDCSLSFYFLV